MVQTAGWGDLCLGGMKKLQARNETEVNILQRRCSLCPNLCLCNADDRSGSCHLRDISVTGKGALRLLLFHVSVLPRHTCVIPYCFFHIFTFEVH